MSVLIDVLQQDPSRFVRRDSVRFLSQIGPGNEEIIQLLCDAFLDEHNDVREACPEALFRLAQRFPAQKEAIIARLLQAVTDPAFDKKPEHGFRSGQDYAYEALWLLTSFAEGYE